MTTPAESPTPTSPLEQALEKFPKKEEAVYLVGQHGISEPIAKSVGERIVALKQGQQKPVEQANFPPGFDYAYHLEAAKKLQAQGDPTELIALKDKVLQQAEPAETAAMIQAATSHPDKLVFNLHETADPWETHQPVIEFILPPGLNPQDTRDFKDFVNQLNAHLQTSAQAVYVNALTPAETHDHHFQKRLSDLPANMLVVEMHTPQSLYEDVDPTLSTLGNQQLRTGEADQQQASAWIDSYTQTLTYVLPVINAEYSKYLRPS
jgi:hypothetical protein